MKSLEATIRNSKTKGDINSLRQNGDVPAIIYGGTEENQKISLSKKQIKNLIEQENFLSNMITLNVESKQISVLPRDISFDPITDDPIHIDFLRIVKGGNSWTENYDNRKTYTSQAKAKEEDFIWKKKTNNGWDVVAVNESA